MAFTTPVAVVATLLVCAVGIDYRAVAIGGDFFWSNVVGGPDRECHRHSMVHRCCTAIVFIGLISGQCIPTACQLELAVSSVWDDAIMVSVIPCIDVGERLAISVSVIMACRWLGGGLWLGTVSAGVSMAGSGGVLACIDYF